MTGESDIVTRLRDHENEGVTGSDRFQLREEAADEIERLRSSQEGGRRLTADEVLWRICDLGAIGGDANGGECEQCPPRIKSGNYEGKQMCRAICEDIVSTVAASLSPLPDNAVVEAALRELITAYDEKVGLRAIAAPPNAAGANALRLYNAWEAARRALSAPVAQQPWLPMETAPKDGAEVLAATDAWMAVCRHYHGEFWSDGNLVEPTHWMPLPPPPKG